MTILPGLALISLLAVGDAPTPSPTLLILSKDDASLAIVDPGDGRLVGRVAVGENPHEVVASADGKLAIVSNYGSVEPPGQGHTLSVIDLAGRKELRRVELAPLVRPHGLSVAGGKIYFTAEDSKILGRYDPLAAKVDWLLGTGGDRTHMVLANEVGGAIVTCNIESDSIGLFDRSGARGGWHQAIIPVGKGPEGFDLSPDGRTIWTAHSGDGKVSIIDVATKKVTATIDAKTTRSNRLKFTEDGKTALISDLGNGDIVAIDVATRAIRARRKLGKTASGILIVPGGKKVYVAVSGDDRVALIDPETLAEVGSIATGRNPDGMAWAVSR